MLCHATPQSEGLRTEPCVSSHRRGLAQEVRQPIARPPRQASTGARGGDSSFRPKDDVDYIAGIKKDSREGLRLFREASFTEAHPGWLEKRKEASPRQAANR